MIVYDPNDDEHIIAMAIWAKKMLNDDAMADIFAKDGIATLSQLFEEFAPPTAVFFSIDNEGIYHVLWYNTFVNAISQGAWVREDKRSSTDVFKNWMEILRAYFEVTKTIIGITQHSKHLAAHTKLGYEVNEAIPELFGENKPGWILYLHKSKFKYLKPPLEKEDGK